MNILADGALTRADIVDATLIVLVTLTACALLVIVWAHFADSKHTEDEPAPSERETLPEMPGIEDSAPYRNYELLRVQPTGNGYFEIVPEHLHRLISADEYLDAVARYKELHEGDDQ